MACREQEMLRIGAVAKDHQRSGRCREWLRGADSEVARVAGQLNGPLALDLARACSYADAPCIDMFRDDGSVVGGLVDSGCGTPF